MDIRPIECTHTYEIYEKAAKLEETSDGEDKVRLRRLMINCMELMLYPPHVLVESVDMGCLHSPNYKGATQMSCPCSKCSPS